MIMANTLYYTLSTIAQSLAGAFGLLAAFVVFRLQLAKTRTMETAHKVARATKLMALFHDGRFDELHLQSKEATAVSDLPQHRAFHRELGHLLALQRILVRRFWVASVATAVTITYAIVGLGSADAILNSPFQIRVVLCVGVGLTVACLASYGLVLYAALLDR